MLKRIKNAIILTLIFNIFICSINYPIYYISDYDKIVTSKGTEYKNKITEKIKKHQAGDTITFGRYEQDNNLDNGEEPIEWVILEKNIDSKYVILISKYIIDCVQFNYTNEDVTWQTSSLRQFMNTEMLSKMFNEEERKHLLPSRLYNSINMFNGNYSGEETVDYIYIPSIDDMYEYFSKNELDGPKKKKELLKPNDKRICYGTDYAIGKGLRISSGNKTYSKKCNYLLRTTGLNGRRKWYNNVYATYFQSFVTELGEVVPSGTCVISKDDGIRPMIKISY